MASVPRPIRSWLLLAACVVLAATSACESVEPAVVPVAAVVGSINFHGDTGVEVEIEAPAVAASSRVRVFGGWDMSVPPTEDRLLAEPAEIEAGATWILPATLVEGVGTYFRVQVVIESLEDGSVRTFRKQHRKSDGDYGGSIPLHSRKAPRVADVS